nr:translation initiation factor IF-2-like [Symphalangus syndactylus]
MGSCFTTELSVRILLLAARTPARARSAEDAPGRAHIARGRALYFKTQGRISPRNLALTTPGRTVSDPQPPSSSSTLQRDKRQCASPPYSAAAGCPLDKKRRPAAPSSGDRGGAARPGHPSPAALCLCWAVYRWCPARGCAEGGGGGGRPGRGSGGRGGDGGVANPRAAHQLTAFAYTRCTPAAGSTKRGAPRAPAASRGTKRGPGARGCKRPLGEERGRRRQPGRRPRRGGIPRRLGRLLDPAACCAALCTPLLRPSFPILPPPALASKSRLSPAPCSSCCVCRRLVSSLGALPGVPQGASARCGLGRRRRSAGPPPPRLSPPPAAAAAAAAVGAGSVRTPTPPTRWASGHISRLQFG